MTEKLNPMGKLEIPIKLSFPVINVSTFEVGRAEAVFSDIANKVGKHFMVMPFKKLPDPNTLKAVADEAKKAGKNGAVVFDAFFFERQKVNPETIPALKASLVYLENEGINYLIAANDVFNHEFVYHVDLPAMNQKDILSLLFTCEQNVQEKGVFTDQERVVIANYALGLSHTQMKNIFTYCSYLKYKNEPYLKEINKEKAHILRDVGLDVIESVSINDVGGLDNLKDFLCVRKAGWEKDLSVKGLLIAGAPGGGKSLIAKAAADVLGTTLVRLDLGRFYSKYLGETEQLFNRALQTIESIAPVVVLIDEIEKFFGTSDGSHEVSQRLLGSFLYWLQERKSKVFIVATANRVQSLPPELMRAGRWDRAFFVGLPNQAERGKILEIHLSKHKADIATFDTPALLRTTEGYTGAEIEQAILDAMYLANAHDKPLDSTVLIEAVAQITPVSQTRREEINEILRLGEQGFYPASTTDGVDMSFVGRKLAINE